MSPRRTAGLVALTGAIGAAVALAEAVSRTSAQDQGPTERPWHVTAARYKFDPPRIEVLQDDLVKIELRTNDIAHSLTIDHAIGIARFVMVFHAWIFDERQKLEIGIAADDTAIGIDDAVIHLVEGVGKNGLAYLFTQMEFFVGLLARL